MFLSKEDLFLCDLGRKLKMLTNDHINHSLEAQNLDVINGTNKKIALYLLDSKVLTQFELDNLETTANREIIKQNNEERLLCNYGREFEILTSEQIELAFEKQKLDISRGIIKNVSAYFVEDKIVAKFQIDTLFTIVERDILFHEKIKNIPETCKITRKSMRTTNWLFIFDTLDSKYATSTNILALLTFMLLVLTFTLSFFNN